MTIFPLVLARTCNHHYVKREYDAKCLYCNSIITLQAYERWRKEKDKKKPQPPQR
jgi:hypothetical protein